MNIINKAIMTVENVGTKVTATISSSFITVATKYGVANPRDYEIKYGVAIPDGQSNPQVNQSLISKMFSFGKIAVPFVLFIVGIVVLISKRISKKFKLLIIALLIILSVIVFLLMDYFSKLMY